MTYSPKVIGDKKGGHTSEILMDPSKMSILEEINQVVRVPMKFIHVTRNPFDNIATMMLRAVGKRNAVREAGAEVSSCSIIKLNYPHNSCVVIGPFATKYFHAG